MDAVESKIREIIRGITGLELNVPGEANLYLDLGVASVHALQLLTELEARFEVNVPDEEFVEATSIRMLSAMIHRLLAQEPEGATSV